MMHHLVHEISVANPQNKTIALFGSSSWNAAGVRTLKKSLTDIKQPYLENTLEVSGVTTDEKLAGVKEFAKAFAEALK
jgi:flavorubredoxin